MLLKTAIRNSRIISGISKRCLSVSQIKLNGNNPNSCGYEQVMTIPLSVASPSTPSTASSNTPLAEDAPGYRQEGRIPTNYEIATGKERYELLKKLAGEEPWTDLKPIVLTQKGTPKNPILVHGTDPERYIGCTGFPADTHELVWLTVRPHKGNHVDRCPHCGNCFKYVRLEDEHH